jgi:hypothetical protein
MAGTTSPTVTPLEGKTSIDDKMTFGPQRLSYSSADAIAQRIASEVIDTVKGCSVVIAGTSLLADFANLQSAYLILRSLQRDYDSVASYAGGMVGSRPKKKVNLQDLHTLSLASLPAGIGAVVGAAAGVAGAVSPVTAALSAAIGLVSLFRQDVEYHGTQTTVDGLAFELALASCVKTAGAEKVYVPDLTFISAPHLGASSLQARLASIQKAKAQAWAAVGPSVAQLVHLEARLGTATTEKNQKLVDQLHTEVSNMRSDLDPVYAPLSRADQRLTDLQTQWNQTDSASGLTLLARLLRAEAIQLMNPHPLYLHAAIVSSGGYNRISHNLFRTMFLGDGLSFTGGAIARWALLDNDGSVTKAGIATKQLTWGTLLGFRDSSQES